PHLTFTVFQQNVGFSVLFLNCFIALLLNIAVVFLIGKTSSLVMCLSGIFKDILLVAMSVVIFGTGVTGVQCVGYGVALVGLVWYKQKDVFQKNVVRNHWLRLLIASALTAVFLVVVFSNLHHLTPTNVSPIHAPTSTQTQPTSLLPEKKFSNLAIAVRTGKETAASHGMAQVVTFLSEARNVVVIGDSDGIRIGGVQVYDVVTGAYEEVEARIANGSETGNRLVKRGERVGFSGIGKNGWEMDAHKFLPGFRMLHSRFPDSEWYIMIGDDSYVFLENYSGFLKTLNPDEPHYIGHGQICGM
ncbi:hypothetical protein HDU98_003701, partial [Podochytrium sp. JEL0797]